MQFLGTKHSACPALTCGLFFALSSLMLFLRREDGGTSLIDIFIHHRVVETKTKITVITKYKKEVTQLTHTLIC